MSRPGGGSPGGRARVRTLAFEGADALTHRGESFVPASSAFSARAGGPASASAPPGASLGALAATSPSDEAAVRAIRESMLAAAGASSTPPSADRATPGAASTWTTAASSDDDSGVRVAESRVEPGAPVVFRVRAAREANPERLDLSRRDLEECAFLEGEHRLRLLNYQRNRIARIARLESVRDLVFLDLHDNRVAVVDGLECVPNLRVLMLGRNRITSLGGHGSFTLRRACPKLDVLDLHDNDVETLAGADEVLPSSIRVLNLAGNARVDRVGDLGGLTNLAELNLRRCGVSTLGPPGTLPATSLRRLFLSRNPVEGPEALEPLRRCASLTELALDGAPVHARAVRAGTREAMRAYRESVVARAAPGLRTLDGEPVAASADAESLSGGAEDGDPASDARRARATRGDAAKAKKKEGASNEPRRDFERTAATEDVSAAGAGSARGDDASSKPRVAFDARAATLTVYGFPDGLERYASAAAAVVFRSRRGGGSRGGSGSIDPSSIDSGSSSASSSSSSSSARLGSALRALLSPPPGSGPSAVAELRFEDVGLDDPGFLDVVASAVGGEGFGFREHRNSPPRAPTPSAPLRRVLADPSANPCARSRLFRLRAIRAAPTLLAVNGEAVTEEERGRAARAFAGIRTARREAGVPIPMGGVGAGGGGGGGGVEGTRGYYSSREGDVREGRLGEGEEAALAAKARGIVRDAAEIAGKLRKMDEAWDGIVRGYVAEGLSDVFR